MNNSPQPPSPRKQSEDEANEAQKHPPGTEAPKLQPAEERGERLDAGKAVARSGGTEGHVPGAMESKK